MGETVEERWSVWCEHADGRRYRMGDARETRWSRATAERVAKHMTEHEAGTFVAQPLARVREKNMAATSTFMPDVKDPRRVWTDLGGDLEGSYDGKRYVDIRVKGTDRIVFVSKGAFEKALKLFDPPPVCD